MKKLSALLVGVIVSLIWACTPDTVVEITLDPETLNAGPGQTVTIKVVLTPDVMNNGEVGDLVVTDADGNEVYSKTYNSANSVEDSVSYTIPQTAQVGSEITLTFTAKDGKSGKTSSKNATITVISLVPELVIETNKTATYVTTNMNSTQWFKLGTNSIELVNATSLDADIATGYNGASNVGHVILAPNNPWFVDSYGANGITYSTSGRKATKIMKYTGNLTYDQLTKEVLNGMTVTTNTFNNGNGCNLVKPGDIYIFETVDGRKGAIKINSINPTSPTKEAALTATMNVDIKYQKTAGGAR